MINRKYSEGFGTEVRISFSYGQDNVLEIWNGYFEILLGCMFDQGIPVNGILHEWQVSEGWYDDSPWEIPDVKNAIQQFSMFNPNDLKTDISHSIAQKLPEITNEIIIFLNEAIASNEKAYILYD